MSNRTARRSRLSRGQKAGSGILIALLTGGLWLNVTTSRELGRTTQAVTAAGDVITIIANVGREASLMALSATGLPDAEEFDAVTVHRALLARQHEIVAVNLAGNVELEPLVAVVNRDLAALDTILESLGSNPTAGQLAAARLPIRRAAESLELAAKRLYDTSERRFLDESRRTLDLRRHFQRVMLGLGLFSALITVGLLFSMRRRASKDLARAFDELVVESQERERAETQLRRSGDRLQALVHNAADVITVVDPHYHVSFQSPSVAGVLGRRSEDMLGRSFLDLVDAEDRSVARSRLAESVARPGQPVRAELHLGTASTRRLYEFTICSLLNDPAVAGIVLNYRDITDRVQLQRQLERQAFTDVLTSLPNRAYLQEEIVRIVDGHEDVAVMFIDLDAFKIVNDSLGHEVGDSLLTAVADRLRGCIRTGDLLARLGGDEFTVIVTDDRVAGICHFADRLIRALAEPFLLGEQVVFVGASIGISTTRDGERCPTALLRDADAAMYRAKADGRNRYELFTREHHEQAVQRMQLENDLRQAIENDGLLLHYQPVQSLTTGRVESVEALVRWRTDSGELIGPDQFIPLAEETGLIRPLGRWVLRQACAQRVEWGRQGVCPEDLTVSVNLSPHQFTESTLVADIGGILAETGLSGSLLVLEITESALIADMRASELVLAELRRMGVRVALDDFGTGYSSLSHLSSLPIDTIKIDRSFVGDMAVRVQDALIVEAVIALAHSLGILATAEGVETVEQLNALGRSGCDSVQGYLISMPVPAEKVAATFAPLRVAQQRNATSSRAGQRA